MWVYRLGLANDSFGFTGGWSPSWSSRSTAKDGRDGRSTPKRARAHQPQLDDGQQVNPSPGGAGRRAWSSAPSGHGQSGQLEPTLFEPFGQRLASGLHQAPHLSVAAVEGAFDLTVLGPNLEFDAVEGAASQVDVHLGSAIGADGFEYRLDELLDEGGRDVDLVCGGRAIIEVCGLRFCPPVFGPRTLPLVSPTMAVALNGTVVAARFTRDLGLFFLGRAQIGALFFSGFLPYVFELFGALGQDLLAAGLRRQRVGSMALDPPFHHRAGHRPRKRGFLGKLRVVLVALGPNLGQKAPAGGVFRRVRRLLGVGLALCLLGRPLPVSFGHDIFERPLDPGLVETFLLVDPPALVGLVHLADPLKVTIVAAVTDA